VRGVPGARRVRQARDDIGETGVEARQGRFGRHGWPRSSFARIAAGISIDFIASPGANRQNTAVISTRGPSAPSLVNSKWYVTDERPSFLTDTVMSISSSKRTGRR